jgi:hypothetical protein
VFALGRNEHEVFIFMPQHPERVAAGVPRSSGVIVLVFVVPGVR